MLAQTRGTASASSIPPQDARKRWNFPSSGACIRSCGSHVALSQRCRGTLPSIEAIRADATAQATFQSSDQDISGTRARQKTYDVVTLGNLCVDVMVPVARLPAPDEGDPSLLTPMPSRDPPCPSVSLVATAPSLQTPHNACIFALVNCSGDRPDVALLYIETFLLT